MIRIGKNLINTRSKSMGCLKGLDHSHNRIAIAVLCGFFMLLAFLYEKCWHIAYFQVPFLGRESPWYVIGNGLCLIALFFSLAFRWQRMSSLSTFSTQTLLWFFISVSIPFLINGIFIYNQPLAGLFRTWFWFSGLLLLIVFHLWDTSCILYRYLFKTMVVLGVFASLLTIAGVLFPPIREVFGEVVVRERFGLIRISRFGSNCIAMAFFFFLVRLLRFERVGKNHILIIIGLLLTTANIFLIQLGRQIIFGVIVASLYFLLRYKKRLEPGKVRLFVVGMGLFLLLLIYSGIVQQILTSVYSDEAGYSVYNSVQSRLDGVTIYFDEFKKSNWIGFGRISTAHNTQGNSIVEALQVDKVYLIDLGLLGSFFEYGIIAVILTIVVLYRWFKDLTVASRGGWQDLTAIAITIELFLVSRAVVLSSFFYVHNTIYFYSAIMYIIISVKRQVSWRKNTAPNQL